MRTREQTEDDGDGDFNPDQWNCYECRDTGDNCKTGDACQGCCEHGEYDHGICGICDYDNSDALCGIAESLYEGDR